VKKVLNGDRKPPDVPGYLQKLLSIEKKTELKKYCRDITISMDDFTMLIVNSSVIGYVHWSEHPEYVPEHLLYSDEELDALFDSPIGKKLTGKAEKCVNKISQTFKERRCLSLHLFSNINDYTWHLFFFDQNSVSGTHWKYGAHMHFVNHLWSNLNFNNDLDDFKKIENMSLHIRCRN
jgi:hypothetical protein